MKRGAEELDHPNKRQKLPTLFQAAKDGDLEAVTQLIKDGIDVNTLDDLLLESPLMMAAKFNHIEIVEILLMAGAELEISSLYNYTALMIAAKYGHTEVIRLLANYNAKVNSSFPS